MGKVIVYYGESLHHSGIKNMKWHTRRYQNEDGTGTDEGNARRRAAYAEKVGKKNEFLKRTSESGKTGLEELKETNAYNANLDMYNKRWKEKNPSPAEEDYKKLKDQNEQARQVINTTNDLVNSAKKFGDSYYNNSKYKISTSDVDVKSLSDDDLNRLNRRLEAEEKYKRLTTVEVADKGAERVRETIELVGSLITIGATGVALYNGVKEVSAKRKLSQS